MLLDQGDSLLQFFFRHSLGMAHDYGAGVFDLIIEKLSEILHVYFGFFCIHHGSKAVELHLVNVKVLHGFDNIA